MAKTKFTEFGDTFRALVKELRLSHGITQADLAARLGHPQSYVSKYETGERGLDFVETVMFCQALEISIEQFAAAFSTRAARLRRGTGG